MLSLSSKLCVLPACLCLFLASEALSFATEPCRIRVLDKENNWPVPLVELRTNHGVRFVTDNTGQVAFDLPELMEVETWFHIEGHGYTVPADGFGMVGVRFVPRRGMTHTIRVQRSLPAKRLGRITGGGLFAESEKLGDEVKWTESRILGCDSVQNAVHNGRMFWGWGDTTLANYPLGRFHMIGATTSTQPLTSLQPPIQLRYDYFTDNNDVPRNVAEMPGDGPTWLSGYASLADGTNTNRLVATYSKIQPPLTEYERGLCVWNETDKKFDRLKVIWQQSETGSRPSVAPTGHATFHTDNAGTRWVYFGDPFPHLRCRATFEEWSQPERWETLEPQEFVMSADSKTKVNPHRGAIAWNAYRNKWVSVFTQLKGESSTLGEIWYAEAKHPIGPWSRAIHVVTHNKYTFYNPQLHPEFSSDGSPILLFEATYTHMFSATQVPTPRHDYNQILYRLDLDKLPELGKPANK